MCRLNFLLCKFQKFVVTGRIRIHFLVINIFEPYSYYFIIFIRIPFTGFSDRMGRINNPWHYTELIPPPPPPPPQNVPNRFTSVDVVALYTCIGCDRGWWSRYCMLYVCTILWLTCWLWNGFASPLPPPLLPPLVHMLCRKSHSLMTPRHSRKLSFCSLEDVRAQWW